MKNQILNKSESVKCMDIETDSMIANLIWVDTNIF